MNLHQLEYLVALDEHKSFSKAAEACFITQATLSTMIKKLEEELGLVLFDRKSSPVITTDYGKEILKEARKVLFHTQRMRDRSHEIRGVVEGTLRLGIIPTVAANLLHRVLPPILKKYPGLTIRVQEITTANILNKIKSGDLDAGIISTPYLGSDLEEEILYYEKLMVYGAGSTARQRFSSPYELNKQHLWLLEKGNCISDQILNVCQLTEKKMSGNLNFHPNSFESLLNIVDTMKGLTLIPELYVMDLDRKRKKNVHDFVAPFPVREISLVFARPYARQRILSAVATEIRHIICPLLQTTKLKNKDMMIAQI
jgi:LysR family transcriptional regulator, hydrogen peroxide-inducible genes activator